MKALWQQLRQACKQSFCRHDLRMQGSHRYAITRSDLSFAGEVTLTLYTCQKCGKDRLIPSDRTVTPVAQGRPRPRPSPSSSR